MYREWNAGDLLLWTLGEYGKAQISGTSAPTLLIALLEGRLFLKA